MAHKRRDYSGRTSSPQDARRGCLCADEETYSIECCDGELINQGIGSLVNQNASGSGTITVNPDNPEFDCTDLTLSGFAVAANGTVTVPTINTGTIVSTSPSSFSIVDTGTTRTLTVNITSPAGFNNSGQQISCTTTATQSATPTFTCSDVTLTGFAVASNGTVTLPSISVGAIASTSPSSFSTVSVDTVRTLTVNITVPTGYFNAGSTVACTTTATQPLTVPTLACSDITISGFAVAANGVVTTPSIDIGTISSTSPSSFATVSVNTSRTLTVNITVPSGYTNTSSTLNCSTTATQPFIVIPAVTTAAGQYAAIDFDFTTSTPEISIFANDPVTGATLADDLALFIGAKLAEQGVTLGSTFSFLTGKNFRFYNPSNTSLAFLETQGGIGTFTFPQPATTGSFPAAPYGAGASSNWTSRGIKFGSSGAYTTSGGTAGPFTIVDNGTQSAHYFAFHQ